MKDHTDCIRGYHRSSKAYYSDVMKGIEVNFGMFYQDGSTTGEMCIEWIEVGENISPRLKAFDDSWSALSLFTDLIKKMGEHDSENISEEDFCKLLDECGFKDLTAYNSPYK